MKQRVAVFFGGCSPEHDVSVVTGLQALKALDQSRYDAFPVYLSTSGEWLVGDKLAERKNYLPKGEVRAGLTEVTLDLRPQSPSRLLPLGGGLFSRPKPIEFEVALLAMHGLYGEDGRLQGALDLAGVAYSGMDTLASAVAMDKVKTKQLLNGLDIPLLPQALLRRPESGLILPVAEIEAAMAGLSFPCCVKPVHLGSSIGVEKVDDLEALRTALPRIFALDSEAMVEPFVQNLIEYNLAVTKVRGKIVTSAIESPKSSEALLSFKQKYLSGGDGKSGSKSGGSKSAGEISQGMLSLTRDINPALPDTQEADIRKWAAAAYAALNGGGAPRIDFLCNKATGEIWLNEINPCPGSFAYFLWEAGKDPLLFSELLSLQLDQAVERRDKTRLSNDPVPVGARLFKRD